MTTVLDVLDLIEQKRAVIRERILSGAHANSHESLENRMVAYRAAVNVYKELGDVVTELLSQIKDPEADEDSLPVAAHEPQKKPDPFEEEDMLDNE